MEKTKSENTAKASALDLHISTKHSIEICNHIRKKSLEKAKAVLQRVLTQKEAIPFKRFNNDIGHKPGKIAAGRYPFNASKAILTLLNDVEANAQTKGLSISDLKITKLCANKASTPWRHGRKRRRKSKRTHLEIIVKSDEIIQEPKENKKEKQKETKQKPEEIKKEVKKEIKKEIQDKKSKEIEEKIKKPTEEVKKEDEKLPTEPKEENTKIQK
ncbi:50S ribosomal protein L22 [Candidatus Woesearchaeota archaeon]|nr:50S ribosomal protein L22 [Candidatus Woesearchaeota archaeon]MBL7050606.1 50S ribosomal protein L22 [Candidatus Woesearchaeota archaeon]